MADSGRRQSLRERLRFESKRWSGFLLWLSVTVGLGLLQVWVLLCVIWGLSFFPNIRQLLGNRDWGIARILGSSVLLFFATSLLGQTIYTLSTTKVAATYRRRFVWLFIGFTSVPLFVLYVLTVLSNEPPVKSKYMYDIFYAVQALAYAAYVEFRLRRDSRLGTIQEEAQ